MFPVLHKTHVTRDSCLLWHGNIQSANTIYWLRLHLSQDRKQCNVENPPQFWHFRRSYCHLFCVHSSFFMLESFCTLDRLHYLVFNKWYVWYVLCFSSLWYLNIPLYRTSGLIRIHVMPSFLQGSARRFSRAIRMFLQPAILVPN